MSLEPQFLCIFNKTMWNLFYEIKQLPQVYQAEGRSKLRLSYFRGILVFDVSTGLDVAVTPGTNIFGNSVAMFLGATNGS